MKLHFDLQVLGFKARHHAQVSTVLYARDLTGRAYPASEVPTVSFHGGSHHAENPDRIAQYAKLNQYHVKCLAYYLDKLRSTPDGDGTLLDHFAGPLREPTWAIPTNICIYDVPHILVGGASGHWLKGEP